MSVQVKAQTNPARAANAKPATVYYTATAERARPVELRALSALEEMYTYFGADRA